MTSAAQASPPPDNAQSDRCGQAPGLPTDWNPPKPWLGAATCGNPSNPTTSLPRGGIAADADFVGRPQQTIQGCSGEAPLSPTRQNLARGTWPTAQSSEARAGGPALSA